MGFSGTQWYIVGFLRSFMRAPLSFLKSFHLRSFMIFSRDSSRNSSCFFLGVPSRIPPDIDSKISPVFFSEICLFQNSSGRNPQEAPFEILLGVYLGLLRKFPPRFFHQFFFLKYMKRFHLGLLQELLSVFHQTKLRSRFRSSGKSFAKFP